MVLLPATPLGVLSSAALASSSRPCSSDLMPSSSSRSCLQRNSQALQEAEEGFGLRDPHVASALNNLLSTYERELEEMKDMTKHEFIAHLRR